MEIEDEERGAYVKFRDPVDRVCSKMDWLIAIISILVIVNVLNFLWGLLAG